MEKVGVRFILRRASGSVMFEVSDHGAFEGDSSKGYEYSEKVLEPSVESLDGIELGCDQIFYSKLQDNWYLYLHSNCS